MSKSKRGQAHVSVQQKGRERDLNTCQVCGSKDQPQGHHIVDYAFGGAADIDNIITLCHSCHRKVHNGTMSIRKF